LKSILFNLLRQLLFWLLFFALARAFFIIYNFHFFKVENVTVGELMSVFFHALPLDLATACYILAIPFLISAVQSFWSPRFLNIANKAYTFLMVVLYAFITGGEVGLYGEWKSKINVKALRYLENPSEVYNSADSNSFFILLMITLLLAGVGIYSYYRFFYKNIHFPAKPLQAIAFVIVTPLLLFLGLRGGWQEIPINQSRSYFSQKNILNLTATNNAFNLYISIFENARSMLRNPFAFYDLATARRITQELLIVEKDTTINILTTSRPNVVMLIMESWSADLIESLGGEPGITPSFAALEKDGLLFTEMLSSGSRSEQGMASIFGGFPAHALSAITLQPDKFIHLPGLVKILKEQGYHTSFSFGGQLIYGNIKGFILNNGFDRVREGSDYPESMVRGKLGVHDEYTMRQLIADLKTEKEPFFAALFTLSSHSPYDQPMEDVFDWGDNERRYINSAYYTDRSLGQFFEVARQQTWYDSTLFIIVADHSKNSYRNHPYHTIAYHSIPMLWTGPVIDSAYRGKQWPQPGSQVDIPATLLAQMHLPHQQFEWSRDLFNPYSKKYRYFGFDNGLIWEEEKGAFSFDADRNEYHWQQPPMASDDSVIIRGKSYLQTLFQEYLDY
jgi:phosphoglycerol transferase MdoB-like AlkP superfamily enzyme